MNQDQTKALLLGLRECRTEFTLIFSGKKSSKVNGLYKPDIREIILHNRNFQNDNELIYTAIHEYAHHLQAETHGGVLSPRAHGPDFWALFHGLLEDAEAKGLYSNVFESEGEFLALAKKIREECLSANGQIMGQLGQLMIEAEALCRRHGARFEDFIDRVLGISRVTARTSMRIASYKIEPSLGYDSMKILAGIRDGDKRAEAERSLLAGKSPDAVKVTLRPPKPSDPRQNLEKEKLRIERTIESLSQRLRQIDDSLRQIG